MEQITIQSEPAWAVDIGLQLGVAILVLLGIAIVVGLLIRLFSKQPRTGLVVGLIAAPLVLVSVLAGLYFIAAVRTREVVTAVEVHNESLGSVSSPAWLPEVEERFEVRVHYSLESAGAGLARIGAEGIRLNAETPGTTIAAINVIHDCDLPAHATLWGVLTSTLRKEFPLVEVESVTDAKVHEHAGDAEDASEYDGPIEVVVRCEAPPETEDSRVETFRLDLRFPDRPTVSCGSILYQEKPWFASPEQYLSTHPKSRELVARSRELATGHEAARSLAEDDAARQLTDLVLAQLNAQSSPAQRLSRAEIEPRIRDSVRAKQFQKDSVSQLIQTDHGNLWRHALLVLSTPETVEELSREAVKRHTVAHQESRQRQYSTIFSLAALVVGVSVIFWGLDGLTKGYYTWRLLLGAGVLVVIGFVLVMA
ncbi:MAG: hypothetical protein KDA60_05250 [Planctomycetales bacterium]|nr:hypothetical protein [Planctomycetales bacterium]